MSLSAKKREPVEIVPQEILTGIYQLLSGWEKRYLLHTPEGNLLVDTPPGNEEAFAAIERLGGARYLFITHRDTVGDAWMYHQRLGVQVIIHAADAAYVTGCPVDRAVQDGDLLAGEARVIHVPGHSPGNCALLCERDGSILFSGDAVITDRDGNLRLPLESYSKDPRQARDSVSRLLRYSFTALLPGHGAPILTGAAERLRAFVESLHSARTP